ncbi:hypothetical protein [Paenibacillus sp. FSL R7-0652]|jgi:hypothetical protein|uniref:DUF2768 domain-containing protein n=1 Tax=Paenibacillus sp. AN1007 TaxID=3151385 RepID=A0AAU8NC94_9BACL
MNITPVILIAAALFSYMFIYFMCKVVNPQASKRHVVWAGICFAILVVMLFSILLLLLLVER